MAEFLNIRIEQIPVIYNVVIQTSAVYVNITNNLTNVVIEEEPINIAVDTTVQNVIIS